MATILINGQTPDALKCKGATLRQAVGGGDELRLSFAGDYNGTLPFSFGQLVAVSINGTQVFEGTVITPGRSLRRPGSGFVVVVKNAWYDLEQRRMENAVKSAEFNGIAWALVDRDIPRVFVGVDELGAHEATGASLARCVNWSAGKGDDVSVGSIDTGILAPQFTAVDNSCLEVIRRILRFHPDWVSWVDGQNRFNARAKTALSTVNIDPSTDECVASAISREDLNPVGVAIVWEKPVTVDGNTRITYDRREAGSMVGKPPPAIFTIELAGAEATTQRVEIGTKSIPADDELSTASAKAFYRGNVAWLEGVDDDDIVIEKQALAFTNIEQDSYDEGTSTLTKNAADYDVDDYDIEDYPRQLIFGEVHEWVDGSSGDRGKFPARLQATIFYKGTDPDILKFMEPGAQYSESAGAWYYRAVIDEQIWVTDAYPGEHSRIDSFNAGADPLANLETTYFNAISATQYQGEINADLSGKFVALAPGNRVTITGMVPTASVVQERMIDLIRENVSIRFGLSKHLDPASLDELSRVTSYNNPSWSSAGQKTAAQVGLKNGDINQGGSSGKLSATARTLGSEKEGWSLSVYERDSTTYFRLNPGKLKSSDDYDDTDEYTGVSDMDAERSIPTNGQVLYIEFVYDKSDGTLTSASIKLGATWAEFPSPYKFEKETGSDDWRMVRYYCLLWSFHTSSGLNLQESDIYPMTDTISAVRIVPKSPVLTFRGRTYLESTDNQRVPVVWLAPDYGMTK